MSDNPAPEPKPKSANLDWRFVKRTLSSLALPILVLGSSCSLNMENRADKLFINKLVRKSSLVGRALDRSISFLTSSCCAFLPLRKKDSEDCSESSLERPAARSSFARFFVLNRFILAIELCQTVTALTNPGLSRVAEEGYSASRRVEIKLAAMSWVECQTGYCTRFTSASDRKEKSVPENWSVTEVSTHQTYMGRRGVMF
jgi:hypothetical protein